MDHKIILGVQENVTLTSKNQLTLSCFVKTYFVRFMREGQITGTCTPARLAAAKCPCWRCKLYFWKPAPAGWRLQMFMTAAASLVSCSKATMNTTGPGWAGAFPPPSRSCVCFERAQTRSRFANQSLGTALLQLHLPRLLFV